jgi:arylsulfatase A
MLLQNVCLFALAATLCCVDAAEQKPNVIILFVDDMGIDQIEVPAAQRAYGYTGNNHTIKTPHISQLASEGMVFQTWYSAFHVCSPSRAAMMTGRLAIRSGCTSGVFVADAVGGLPLNETTIASAVKPMGYKSMIIGKWVIISFGKPFLQIHH